MINNLSILLAIILLATVVQFVLGAVWYSPLMFGKWWMQIMEVAHLSKEELQKMQKEMWPFYLLQFVITFIFTVSFFGTHEMAAKAIPGCSIYQMVIGVWFGFVLPIQIGSVIWGNTKKKYWLKQIFVMTSYQIVSLLLAAFIWSVFN